MSTRFPRNALAPQHQLVDADRARAAIAHVAQERDALARQLSGAQDIINSLRRQLDAREAEALHLAQTLRALQSSQPDADHRASARQRQLLQQASVDLDQTRQRCAQAESQANQAIQARDQAIAERDQERAARHRLQAEQLELRAAAPDADRAQRLAADLANLRRHQDASVARGIRTETTRLLKELASVRDSVSRALDANLGESGPWHDGLLAIQSKLDGVLNHEGATLLGRVGERFDPAIHEAVGSGSGETPGVILSVVSSGLMLRDGTLLVPARVIVTQ
ncbi:MAG: nucleotide exchange factor GrpE [Oligoflexia bacterium]|nr:nucleotide exchange factor GrpE [Oligoflexia bacterium]